MRFRDGDQADRLQRLLQGDGPTSHDPRIRGSLLAAAGLAPAEPLSESKRKSTLAMALRELGRTPAQEETPDAGTRDGDDAIAPHTAVVTSDDIRIVMADLEPISPERAARAAELSRALLARAAQAAAEEYR